MHKIAAIIFIIMLGVIVEIIIGIAMDLALIIMEEVIMVAVAMVLNILYRKSLLFSNRSILLL
jgi:hypothetical protein